MLHHCHSHRCTQSPFPNYPCRILQPYLIGFECPCNLAINIRHATLVDKHIHKKVIWKLKRKLVCTPNYVQCRGTMLNNNFLMIGNHLTIHRYIGNVSIKTSIYLSTCDVQCKLPMTLEDLSSDDEYGFICVRSWDSWIN